MAGRQGPCAGDEQTAREASGGATAADETTAIGGGGGGGMEKARLLLGVLALHGCIAGFHVVSRMALDMGVSEVVFMVYRNAAALALVAPFAYFLEKKDRPPLTLALATQLFILASFVVTGNQGFYLVGLYYLSPTYASAIQNSIPAITFALAVALRLEQININKTYGLAKVIGTGVSLVGATIITLYKGIPLMTNYESAQRSENIGHFTSSNPYMNWTLGCLFLLGNCLSWSGWMVLQVPMLKRYPASLSMLAICLVFGLIQLLAIAAFCERDIQRWKVHSAAELFTILYAGLVASGVALSLQIWCIHRGGPLFTVVFQPAQTIMVGILAALVLGDRLYTGGIIASVIIVIGLYLVLWGKSEENKFQGGQQIEPSLSRRLLDEQESSH